MNDENIYVDELRNKLGILKQEILKDRKSVRLILKTIDEKETLIQNIVSLLRAEGISEFDDWKGAGSKQISDIVYEYLVNREEKKGVYYRELADKIQTNGFYIPGKDPSANLLAHLNRDNRFVRVGRGIYGLREWGLKEIHTKRRKR
ncbi:MAG: winged helix-turn-helix domain-containing protein [Promethearchaeota archaeon]